MKLLANENIPLGAVRQLRGEGHDVLSITESSPGIDDISVLKLAAEQGRILLTFDRDYGELLYVRRLPCPLGVLYLRFTPDSPTEAAERIKPLLIEDGRPLQGHFVVLDREGYRRRPLPG